jgi:hypothetical protein
MLEESVVPAARKGWDGGRLPSMPPCYAGFEAIDPARERFLVVGDTQWTSLWEVWRERNVQGRRLLLDEIARRDPAFVLHLGDLTARGDSRRQWARFDALHERFREKGIPYFPVLGNHEFHGRRTAALESFFRRFPHLEQRRWYGFAWRNVAFLLLDSNFRRMSPAEREELSRWYVAELERLDGDPSIEFVIVCSHRPPYTQSRVVRPCAWSRERFVSPFLGSRKTRFFFSGHAHAYERFSARGKHFVVSGGGGGPRHRLLAPSRHRRFEDASSGPALRLLHACEVEHVGARLEFRVVKLEDGAFGDFDSLVVW